MKKKVILIIVPILIIIIVVAVLAVLYFTTDLFKTNEELFWKYFAQNENVINILANDKSEVQSQFKQSNSYTANGSLSVNVEQGENSFKQLNVETNTRHDAISGRTYADAILKNGDIDLFEVSYINSGDIYAIKCDEVFANYVGIRNSGLQELATNYGVNSSETIPDSIDINEYINLLEITEEQKQHIADTYLQVISNNIAEEKYTKAEEDVGINGNLYNANVYRIQLTGEEAKQIMIDCLTTLKTDTETLVLISNKLSTLGFGVEYTDITNLNLRIDELIAQIEQMTMENYLNISVYENDGETIRTVIEIENLINIIYDRTESSETLTLDLVQEEGIINGVSNITSRIIITKDIAENLTTNNIQIIPDINDIDSNISVMYNLSNIQSDSINNSYNITINDSSSNIRTITVNYNNNIIRADQVEEITELTNANTAVANNYTPEEFMAFMNNWTNLFSQKFMEKMAIIGFNDIGL